MWKKIGKKIIFLPLIFINIKLYANDIKVNVAVSSQKVYVGQPITYQIQISGSDSPEQPDLSFIKDFNVRYVSGGANNSHSITIINGVMSQTIYKGYIMTYSFTPKKSGNLVIPSFEIKIEGKTYKTPQVPIEVMEPSENEDYKIKIFISESECYVGQPITLKLVWYWAEGKDVRALHEFQLPILNSTKFEFINPEQDTNKQYYQILVANQQLLFERGEEIVQGRKYITLTYRTILIPKEPGSYSTGKATISFDGVTGVQEIRDFFGRLFRQNVYSTIVIPSNEKIIKVNQLPTQGKPNNFTGWIGDYKVSVKADPLEVNVGDPIILTIKITGSGYLKGLKLPELEKISDIDKDFKVSSDRSAPKYSGNSVIYTQTIRARNDTVKFIPSLEIPYFDTKTGKYSYTKSNPIPIKVNPSKSVTFKDVEGIEKSNIKSTIETFTEGIAHNYDDDSVLINEKYGILNIFDNTIILILMFLSFFIYIGLIIYKKINTPLTTEEDLKLKTKNAFKFLIKNIDNLKKSNQSNFIDQLYNIYRDYLGKKFKIKSDSLTFIDIEPLLLNKKIDNNTISRIKNIFKELEMYKYAKISQSNKDNLINDIIETSNIIEKYF